MCVHSSDVLRGFSMPTFFITGEEDTTFPPFIADALAPLMPNGKVEQVRNTGHSVYFERASIFNHLVDRFFTTIG
jgi:3-oxoadipate enol-lactonase